MSVKLPNMNVLSFFEVLFSQDTTSSGFDPRIWFSFPLFFSSSLTGPHFRWATFPVYKSPDKTLLCLSLIDSQSREEQTRSKVVKKQNKFKTWRTRLRTATIPAQDGTKWQPQTMARTPSIPSGPFWRPWRSNPTRKRRWFLFRLVSLSVSLSHKEKSYHSIKLLTF